ncbi:MAG: helix-turn-helix transcriptional regulator [Erysipelotrichaceae bacterium]|nr:helix-turn-helix transcriptional regulator [Erysipelotrichaceae bacterium]
MVSIRKRNHPVIENVIKVMEAEGISIDELSISSGINEEDLDKVLRNKRVIRPYEIAALSKALNVSPNELFSFPEEDEDSKD